MPHLSKNKLSEKTAADLDKFVVALLVDTAPKTRRLIVRELLTNTERLMIAKRIALIFHIQAGTPTHSIAHLLKMSPSTVARFERGLEKGSYAQTRTWVKSAAGNRFLKLVAEFIAIPFDAPKKSVAKVVDEFF